MNGNNQITTDQNFQRKYEEIQGLRATSQETIAWTCISTFQRFGRPFLQLELADPSTTNNQQKSTKKHQKGYDRTLDPCLQKAPFPCSGQRSQLHITASQQPESSRKHDSAHKIHHKQRKIHHLAHGHHDSAHEIHHKHTKIHHLFLFFPIVTSASTR